MTGSENTGSALEVRSLVKRYGPAEVVRGISFSVPRGQVLGFLGPNGAGKSTTMKMVTGYLPVTAGEIRVLGHDIQLEPLTAQRAIGYLPEGSPLYGDMTTLALLQFSASVRGLTGKERRERVDRVVEQLELRQVLHQRIGTLSKGYKRRVGIAQAIFHDPPVLILDEPTDGLDPNQKRQVRDLIRLMSNDKAIIISTHLLEEVDAICDHAVIIDRGAMVFDGVPAELHALARDYNTVVVWVARQDADRAAAVLRAVEGVESVRVAEERDKAIRLAAQPKDRLSLGDKVGAALAAAQIGVVEMRIETGRLDDVFHDVTVDAPGSSR